MRCAALEAALSERLNTQSLGRALEWMQQIGSTNTEMRARAEAGAAHGLVLLAEQQTHGRGRLGRAWQSPPGAGLYLSCLLRPRMPLERAPRLGFSASLALADALADHGLTADLKWPNDVLVNGKKLAGILSEMHQVSGQLSWVVVGVGLNVNLSAAEMNPADFGTATSFLEAAGRPGDRPALAASLLNHLERWASALEAGLGDTVLDAWRSRTITLGRRVRYEQAGHEIAGVADDLTEDGSLIIKGDDLKTYIVTAGDVRLEG